MDRTTPSPGGADARVASEARRQSSGAVQKLRQFDMDLPPPAKGRRRVGSLPPTRPRAGSVTPGAGSVAVVASHAPRQFPDLMLVASGMERRPRSPDAAAGVGAIPAGTETATAAAVATSAGEAQQPPPSPDAETVPVPADPTLVNETIQGAPGRPSSVSDSEHAVSGWVGRPHTANTTFSAHSHRTRAHSDADGGGGSGKAGGMPSVVRGRQHTLSPTPLSIKLDIQPGFGNARSSRAGLAPSPSSAGVARAGNKGARRAGSVVGLSPAGDKSTEAASQVLPSFVPGIAGAPPGATRVLPLSGTKKLASTTA